MREIYYNSDITPSAVNEIKLLALYYDKIHIINDAVYSPKFEMVNNKMQFTGSEKIEFIPKSFNNDYKILIQEGLISITEKKTDDEDKFASRISEIVNHNHNIIYPDHPTEKDGKIITEEVYNVMKYMFDFDWGKPVETNLMWWYYAFKLNWSINLLLEGKTCLSSSNNLSQLFSKFLQQYQQFNENLGSKGYSKSLALDAIRIRLPNPSDLEFDDILELKIQLKDELGIFAQTINAIEVKNKNLFSHDIPELEYQAVFYEEILKPLNELETKMKNLKSKAFRSFVEKMQNPMSYAPLLGTVVASAPIEYMISASVGLTGINSYIEYKEEHREIRNNGMYFLLKLK